MSPSDSAPDDKTDDLRDGEVDVEQPDRPADGPQQPEVDASEGDAYLESNRVNREKMRAREAKKEARSARVASVTGRMPKVDWSTRGMAISLITVLGGLVIITGGLSIWLWTERSDLQQQVHDLKSQPNDAARAAVMEAAKNGIVQFGTFEPDQLDDWDQRLRAVTTRGFAQTQLASGQLKQAVSQTGASSKGVVTDVGIESMTANSAVVLAFLNQTYRSPDIAKMYPNGQPYLTRIKSTMKLVDGRWLIDSLDIIS
jgi:hypothetical protein